MNYFLLKKYKKLTDKILRIVFCLLLIFKHYEMYGWAT
jgi:hypothetical protein